MIKYTCTQIKIEGIRGRLVSAEKDKLRGILTFTMRNNCTYSYFEKGRWRTVQATYVRGVSSHYLGFFRNVEV